MTYICYQDTNFRGDTLAVINKANEIIEGYQAQGFTLTLRQLYYQFISRDIFPNTEQSYNRLGSIITDARLAGLVSWDAIEDRGRGVKGWLIEENEADALEDIEYRFALDLWRRQNVYVEVWVEKEALSSVIERPCRRRLVPYMACKGYLSASEAWRSGRRYEEALEEGRECVLIHLGDHDPSGIDMTRDNAGRLELFARERIDVRRIALNMPQVELYNPPPNPAKMTDSRASDYVANFGRTSWELDALEPSIIADLITTEVESLIDDDLWADTLQEQSERRAELAKLHSNWPAVAEFLKDIEA